jgi:formate hydrogenlyase subunit 4
MVAILTFGIIILLPWNLSPVFGMTGAGAVLLDLAFFVLKVIVVSILSVTIIRTMMARLRITQVVKLYWFIFGGLGIIAIILLMLDAFFLGVI